MSNDATVPAIAVLLTLAFAVFAITAGIWAKSDFMEECQAHLPKFQCTAMWRD